MKKVLHISKYYTPFVGGIEQIARDCVSALIDEYEQKVICFNHEPEDKEDEVDGVPVIRCGCQAKVSSQSLSVTYGKKLKTVIQKFEPDYIVFHYPNPFVSHYLLQYAASETKLIVYWHLDIIKQKILGKIFHGQNLRLLERANQIIATSPNYIDGSSYLSLYKEKCIVIPNCINEERMKKTELSEQLAGEIREKNKGKIICLAVGRHTEYKGFEYLIQASRLLDDRFKIYISGQGQLTEKLHGMAQGDDKIAFLGRINDDTLKAYLTAADIFCFPSITKNEAFGVALAEAMYYEKPAVTFTIPGSGVNYVSVNGETGIEVPNRNVEKYAEALNKLAGNAALAKQYGMNGRKRVMENFLYSQFRNNIKQVFELL